MRVQFEGFRVFGSGPVGGSGPEPKTPDPKPSRVVGFWVAGFKSWRQNFFRLRVCGWTAGLYC